MKNRSPLFIKLFNESKKPTIEIFEHCYTYNGSAVLTPFLEDDKKSFIDFQNKIAYDFQELKYEFESLPEVELEKITPSCLTDIDFLLNEFIRIEEKIKTRKKSPYTKVYYKHKRIEHQQFWNEEVIFIPENAFSFFIEKQKEYWEEIREYLIAKPNTITDYKTGRESIKITIDRDIINEIYIALSPFFNEQDHEKLLQLLQGKTINTTLVFYQSFNKLIDAFRRLNYHSKVNETKKKIVRWIFTYFKYKYGKNIKQSSIDSISKAIKINSNARCKNPIPYFREHYKFPYEKNI